MSIERVKSKKFASGYGYRLDFHRRGHKRVREIFESRALAQAVRDKLSGDAVRRKHDLPIESDVRLSDLIDHHLERIKQRGRPKTAWIETILTRFRDICGADRLVETIKTADLNRYVESRLSAKRPPKPGSINREMVEIKSCLTAARQYFGPLEGWVSPRAPWQQEEDSGRRQTWTAENTRAVLAQLYAPRREREQEWQHRSRVAVGDMFYIARRVGLRAGEARTLRRIDVDFKTATLTIKSRKGVSRRKLGKTRFVPAPEDVLEILKRRAKASESEWIFPNRNGSGPASDYLKAFRTACERAKIDYGLAKEGALIFNDARRTAENEMLEAGHSPRAIGDLFGHSPVTMARHYARSTDEQRRRAMEATGWAVHEVSTPPPEMPEMPDLPKRKKRSKAASKD
ncbi:MAG: tyrosine-type recombinase/integrase [Blastocatellia bacterium]